MLTEADAGFLFNAFDNVIQEFPQFPATRTYGELKAKLYAAVPRLALYERTPPNTNVTLATAPPGILI